MPLLEHGVPALAAKRSYRYSRGVYANCSRSQQQRRTSTMSPGEPPLRRILVAGRRVSWGARSSLPSSTVDTKCAPAYGTPEAAPSGTIWSTPVATCSTRRPCPRRSQESTRRITWCTAWARAGTFEILDQRAASDFAAAAAAAGLHRIIYLGGVAPRGRASEHLASRLEVGRILRAGRVPAVELRAAMIIGSGSASWQIVRDLALRLPAMVLPAWLSSRLSPIALEDTIHALLDALESPCRRAPTTTSRDRTR